VAGVGTVGAVVLAVLGALIGGSAGLTRCKQEDRLRARRALTLPAAAVGGAALGFMVSVAASRFELRYDMHRIVFEGGQSRVEDLQHPRGQLRVWLFGRKTHDEDGPREEMIARHNRLCWAIPLAFLASGATLGLFLGFQLQRLADRRA
jgi:hypothetical protein